MLITAAVIVIGACTFTMALVLCVMVYIQLLVCTGRRRAADEALAPLRPAPSGCVVEGPGNAFWIGVSL